MIDQLPFLAIFSALALLAYLFGSICAAIIVCKLFGLPDPRTAGSHNAGATNVMRIGGKLPALLTFLADALKGVPAILLAQAAGFSTFWLGLIGFFALLGHAYPVFFRFVGGKGIATAFGVLLALNGLLFGVALLVWGAIFALWRISSVASLSAFVLVVPVASLWINVALFWPLCAIAALVLWRHRQNIADVWAGTERVFKS